jgi:hypothetical protein
MILDEILTYIQGILPAVITIATPVGAALVWIIAERKKYQKTESDRANTEAERERSYAERITNRLKVSEETIERLTLELVEERLKHNVGLIPSDVLRTIVDNDPGLSWVKHRVKEGVYNMVRVSDGYAKLFLKGPAGLYDGKSDYDIWPKEIADQFVKNDELVYKTQEGHHIVEPTTEGRFVGRKFPVRLSDGQDYIVGIGVYEPHTKFVVEEKKE